MLNISGITPLTTIDYPDHLAMVVYLQGCAWRCRYCHNPEMIPTKAQGKVTWESVKAMIEERLGFLDAIVFSGGEATLQCDLAEAVRWVKSKGLKVGLHTGGARPDNLRVLLPNLDWVGFDVKGLPNSSDAITQVAGASDKAWMSLDQLMKSSVDYECRTTVHWSLTSPDEILRLAKMLKEKGVKRFSIQEARTSIMLDDTLGDNVCPITEKQLFFNEVAEHFPVFEFR